MSSIAQAFSKAKAFIPFITCGDPNLAFSEKAIYTLAENGADIIELGIPFSDPVAEGGVIQKATARALESGTSVEDVFRLVAKVRTKSGVPLVLMTYANIVFSYGSKEFFAKARELGVNGVILPDVPYEEREEFARFAQGIDLIPLIAPTSNDRIAMLATNAQGFIYCVSSLGVTGVRENIPSNESIIARIKQASSTPVAVGFGISTPDQVKEIARYADGVIIGSAVVSICALNESEEVRLQKLGAYAREIRAALDSAG
ncbi:tryptophan synthase subunit alpha [Helicobacter canis]|uniref:Tryptophan synthase alpha chain n=1 Tax=Helicobacter canis TaxID=29419 RepID=A0A377JKZ9_9HELI|nr:tryptophan synthase subunit alpha [Helicobacter canis]STP06452.1 tryptophan synthase subunit alpha [Helicobacter canis]